ncbi:disease resistance protein RPM1-like [Elaeis guineensis]|uniref:Disease resistance protein RPM1-like n=1 Tax=Elaeis guineensis var. tenera TaxID=51953 RepID=A0A6I9QS63_ELAGV|nr:disease resistance protein RPM1-like [Elaeis guineensis]
MAEIVVSSLIEKITEALASVAIRRVGSLLTPERQVHSKISDIKGELHVMQEYLRYADRYRGSDRQVVRAWLNGVRDVAFQIEDIVDEYTYIMARRNRSNLLMGHLFRVFNYYHDRALHDIATRLEKVEIKLGRLSETNRRYSLRIGEGTSDNFNNEREMGWRLAVSAHFLKEDGIVGVEEQREQLIRWLTDEEPRRTTVSVWGMGGVGKTTLVTGVYKGQRIIGRFDCRLWVYVSQSCTTADLLRRIMREFYRETMEAAPHDICSMDHRMLVETIRAHLQQKRYLIILDDVWQTDVWTNASDALFDNNRGSRVVITTRKQEVATMADDCRVVELKPLKEEEAWTLFCRKAFQRERHRICPQELEYWARRLVEKCEGLPLAIVTLGNVLAQSAKTELAWKNVHDNLLWEKSNNPDLHKVSVILSLSINDLPTYLRNCFLYCSIFPEDYLIERKRLIRLWVAEGFVKGETGESSREEVAEDYLNQLVGRCMLQVVRRNEFGRTTRCQVHDLMRELIVARSREENFCEIYDHNLRGNAQHRVRRLSIIGGRGDHQSSMTLEQLCSFHVFPSSSVLSPLLLPKFKLLRVLDLHCAPIDRVPDEVVHLFNLRYLSVRGTKVRELPKAVGRLRNLETLDAWLASVENLPRGTTKLENLRHLMVKKIQSKTSRYTNSVTGVHAPDGIENLKSLQTLKAVVADEDMIKHLGNLTHLRRLEIVEVRNMHCAKLSKSIVKMKHLRHLVIARKYRQETLSLEALSPPPPLLRKLGLYGKLDQERLPNWLISLANLTHLTLQSSGFGEDSLRLLSSLPNLVFLILFEAYDGQHLHFKADWFPQLNVLRLQDMARLSSIEIEQGALINLQELLLVRCRELKMVPLGLENVTRLQRLELDDMPKELVDKLREGRESKEDRSRIQHIPVIMNWAKTGDNCWTEERLS